MAGRAAARDRGARGGDGEHGGEAGAGADVLVRYTEEDVEARVKEEMGGKGVVAVFDGVGKATFDVSLRCVARKGTLVCFGNASGPVPPVDIL